MIQRIRILANQMRMKREQGDEKFVLLLGAGASISSGVPPPSKIMAELLTKYNDSTSGDLAQRFDALWANGQRVGASGVGIGGRRQPRAPGGTVQASTA